MGSLREHHVGLLWLKLDVVQLRVKPARGQQFGVRAALDDRVIFHDENDVSLLNRCQVMGNNDRGLSLHQPAECLEYRLLGLRVQS